MVELSLRTEENL